MTDFTIFICDDETEADRACGFLAGVGYAEAEVRKAAFGFLLYDARTYGGSATDEHADKWVVIGQK